MIYDDKAAIKAFNLASILAILVLVEVANVLILVFVAVARDPVLLFMLSIRLVNFVSQSAKDRTFDGNAVTALNDTVPPATAVPAVNAPVVDTEVLSKRKASLICAILATACWS